MATNPPAGWYKKDPQDDFLRWWDGEAWGDQIQSEGSSSTGEHRGLVSVLQDTVEEVKEHKTGATQAAGAAMVLDGLVGIDNPLSGRQRAGIFGGLVAMVVGVAIIVMAITVVKPNVGPGYLRVVATVDHYNTSVNSGKTEYTAVYSFMDRNLVTHELVSSMSSSTRPTIGSIATVAYDPEHPENAVVTSGFEGNMWKFMIGFGALFALIGFGTFIVRAVTLGVGVGLLLRSRKKKKV
jgi:hypothetical protein